MKRFVEGEDRSQVTLLPECWTTMWTRTIRCAWWRHLLSTRSAPDGLRRVAPAATGRPAYHPVVLLKLYIYGYLNRVQSSRRLEREAQRNVE